MEAYLASLGEPQRLGLKTFAGLDRSGKYGTGEQVRALAKMLTCSRG